MSAIRAYLKGLVEEAKRPAEGVNLSLSELRPRAQPRRRFEDASLKALAESIRSHGVLEPLLVRKAEEGYEIIAGERRYRAAKMAGLEAVPAIVLEVDEKTAQAIALMENLQREDLNPYEETLGVLDLLALELGRSREEVVSLLHRMRDEVRGRVPRNVTGNSEGQKVEEVFRTLGRMDWQSFVRNRLPLLNLPPDLREALEDGSIPYTAALELKKVKDEALRRELLEEVKEGLSLRDLKARIREASRKKEEPRPTWHREVLKRLSRLDLEALPLEKRRAVERHLQALARELGVDL
ncbi:chromosome partitioning protein ParB [Thermus scotoductus]|uniref:Chromosome partitioning protein ParB n=1 Tax=Thermus scotoductus TaxID=37636 RepID=A0A430RGV4_THESC|nr:ParB/RepB/Spo0J family partition protein [Thermus scotoductus]RTG93634.1 chromosome partitioning protein ParB [Thermus scotoductus]RTH07428.1 chromosome partitioning protein ParB [Thermus scotoductus]RTH17501.1 chromosome partitioning protein ParB [Thermus scotoductus]RTH97544.1 chromosome partitioning protein ParB [Thermus scotoductus]RTI01864.1 chromosome partitioning protein ParB [Thermus scotoductus]